MLRIGGFQELSLIDYPGKIAAVVFCQGCNFRCPFCHNPELVLPEKMHPPLNEDKLFQFFKKRQNQLQGVVVTGGEPTIQKGLGDFLKQVKSLGYFVKLDTNGYQPARLAQFIEKQWIDYIAMDIKAPFAKYHQAAGVSINTKNITDSINLILQSGLDYQFRTTVVKEFLQKEDIQSILSLFKTTKHYRLQRFNAQRDILDSSLLDRPDYTIDEFQTFETLLRKNATE